MRVATLDRLLSPVYHHKYRQGELTVVAVCKYQPDERVKAAFDAGYRHFGESTLQGLIRSTELLSSYKDVHMHFVGRLQSNKIKKICSLRPHMIHSVAQNHHLDILLNLHNTGLYVPKLLLQVNCANNPNQEGLPPTVDIIVKTLSSYSHLPFCGLMTVGPNPQRFESESQWLQETDKAFATLANLRTELHQAGYPAIQELSMGMSSDYTLALKHGATLIRLGHIVFN